MKIMNFILKYNALIRLLLRGFYFYTQIIISISFGKVKDNLTELYFINMLNYYTTRVHIFIYFKTKS